MTPRKPIEELEADEFVCVRCGSVAQEHALDGMSECPVCADGSIDSWLDHIKLRREQCDPDIVKGTADQHAYDLAESHMMEIDGD